MPTDDVRRTLIARAQAGDWAAVDTLLDECRPILIDFINRQLPPHLRTQVAEEIVQDALARAWTKLAGFDWRDFEAFAAWLKEFAQNGLADWHKYVTRQKRNYQRLLGDGDGNNAPDSGPSLLETAARDDETPSRLARRREREDALIAAMRTELTDNERAALVLRYFKDLSVPTVAAVMEISPGYVKNLCLSGKRKLREALGRSSQFFSSR